MFSIIQMNTKQYCLVTEGRWNNEQTFYESRGNSRRIRNFKNISYKIIKELNEELEKMGYKTLAGRVSRKFFNEKFYGINENAEEKVA